MSLSNPNADRICCSLVSFSTISRRSRVRESVWRSIVLICLVDSLSFSDNTLSLSSNSVICPMDEPDVEISSCSFSLSCTSISFFNSFWVSSSLILFSNSCCSNFNESSSSWRRLDWDFSRLSWVSMVVNCDSLSRYSFTIVVFNFSISIFLRLILCNSLAIRDCSPLA